MNLKFLEKYFEDSDLKKYKKIAKKIIKYQETQLKSLGEAALTQKTQEFRNRFKKGESLNSLLVEAFAVCREMAWRKIGLAAYDVQLIASIAVFEGKIIEMKTGEGKTLTISFATYLRGIAGYGVHVVTTNDYLAKRDAEWIGQVYSALGLSVSCLQAHKSYMMKDINLILNQREVDEEKLNEEISDPVKDDLVALDPNAGRHRTESGGSPGPIRRSFNASFIMKEEPKYGMVASSRQDAYRADIVYGTNHEFGFDYLRDNMAMEVREIRRTRPLYFAIIDEVDSILIDEAQTPLIVSRDKDTSADLFVKFNQAILNLTLEDYVVDEKNKITYFTESGIDKMEQSLGIQIYGTEGSLYAFHAEMALRAHLLFKKDRDYIVFEDKIYIIDEYTGRMMKGHKYAEGVHQAIEAKENLLPGAEAVSLALTTFQNFFKLYTDFAGLTGTAIDSAKEFQDIYQKDVVIIPTHKFVRREDKTDLFYLNIESKVEGIVQQIQSLNQEGRPILLGTHSVKESEVYSTLFEKEGIKAQVLNAKNHELEAEIVSEAGKKGKVTVSTNMAGRGTDIKIDDEIDHMGGLEVISTGRVSTRRVDNQLIGRAGRQGNRGGSQFHISMEDELIRFYMPPHIREKLSVIPWPENGGTSNKDLIEGLNIAQSIASTVHEEQRRHIFERDKVLDYIRRKFYVMRRKILVDDDLGPEVRAIMSKQLKRLILDTCSLKNKKKWKPELILEEFKIFISPEILARFNFNDYPFPKRKEFEKALINFVINSYNELTQSIARDELLKLERKTVLEILDALWVDYLKSIKYLDEVSAFTSFDTTNSIFDFRIQADKIYRRLENISGDMVMKILFISLSKYIKGKSIEGNAMAQAKDMQFRTK